MLLPCEAILGEPEGFHLKKEKHKPKQAASHKSANNTSDKKSSEDEFQGLTLIQIRRVRTREGPSVKDRERRSTPPKHEDAQFKMEVTNNAPAARQDFNKTGSRKK